MEQPTPTTFGDALRAERKRLGLTQAELARQIETSQQNIAGWEAGRSLPRQEHLDKLIAFFGAGSFFADLELRSPLLRMLHTSAMNTAVAQKNDLLTPDPDAALAQYVEQSARAAVAAHVEPRLSFKRAELGLADARAARRSMSLRPHLPQHLHQYVDRRMAGRELDYWGEKIAVEVKTTRHTMNVPMMAQIGMHQLSVFRAAMQRDGVTPPPHIYLALVMQDGVVNATPGGRLLRVQEEAALLGFGCIFASSIESVARFIVAAERGELDSAEEEEIEHPDAGSW